VSGINDYQFEIEQNLRKVRLCRHVVEELHRTLINPIYPEDKADLLLATEDLLSSTFALMETVSEVVWQDNLRKPTTGS
jgi:hypothetical protein